MKQILCGLRVATAFVLLPYIGLATTYYSKTTGFANQFSTWGTYSDGTGTSPLSFSNAGDLFILRAQSTLGLNGQWTIGANVTLQVDGYISVTYNNHDININGTIIFTNPSATQVSLTGGGNGNSFIVSAAATIKTANLNGLKGLNCSLPASASGNIILNANANYAFTGAGTQLTTGLPSQIKDLIISNGQQVEVMNSVILAGNLYLQNGILKIAPGATLEINSPASLTGSGYGSTKHINTMVNVNTLAYFQVNSINGTVTLPIGNGISYMPVTINSSLSTDIRVNVFEGITANGLPGGTPISATNKNGLVDAVWNIERMSGSNPLLITVNWPQALEGSSFSLFGNNEIGIARNLGSYWDLPLGSGNQSANTATISSVTNLGAFGVGRVGIPLPLKFGSLKLTGRSGSVNVNWTTLTEYNVAAYFIERSKDGLSFQKIGEVPATIDNSSTHVYNWIDHLPLDGNSYYRVKAKDIDGKETFSSVVRLSMVALDNIEMAVYPNPVLSKELTVQAMGLDKGIYHLTLRDIGGRIIFQQDITHTGGSISEHILLPSNIGRGIYNLSLEGSFGGMHRKVKIQ